MADQKRERRRDARVQKWEKEYPHIVDQLIRERAKNLSRSRWWPLYRFCLNGLLGYKRAVEMADHIEPLSGFETFEYVSQELGLKLRLKGLENIPADGLFILAINHPTGLADGVAVFDALKKVRPDLIFFANSDAIRMGEGMNDIIIPVEWVEEKKTRAKSKQTLVSMTRAAKDQRALILFPSGKLAFMDEQKVLTEQVWQQTVAALPKKYQCPLIPAYMTGRNSWLYYWFRNLNGELRDMTLFHELLNKQGKEFDITIGKNIPYTSLPDDADKGAALLREYVTTGLPKGIEWDAFIGQCQRS